MPERRNRQGPEGDRFWTLAPVDLVVTGSAGRLGRVLRAAWAETSPPALRPHWLSRDGRHGTAWDMLSGPVPDLPSGSVILHLAFDRGGSPDSLLRNATMTAALLQAARQSRARTILFASSAAVYAPGASPCRETDPPQPPAAYGRAKIAAEQTLLAQSDVPAHVLRIGNIAGIDALLGPRDDSLPILLDPVSKRAGGPIRSWIGAQSLAGVLVSLCHARLPHILNVAADPPLPMADLLAVDDRPWRYGPPREGVLPQVVLDTTLLRTILPVAAVSPAALVAEARWARTVLA